MLEQDFEQRMRLGRLFDMYGGLLTEKQQQCLKYYFYDDLSLTEIGEELGVSRQAVHDLLKRVEQTLEKNEIIFFNAFEKVINGKKISTSDKVKIREYIMESHGNDIKALKECEFSKVLGELRSPTPSEESAS